MTGFDTDAYDAIIVGVGWLLGLSMVLVGGSLVAFTFWWATQMSRVRGLGKPLARALLAWTGIGLATFGAASIAIGTEAALGYPFGDSSGGMVLFAYLLGLRLATWELAVSHGVLHGLTARTESTLHQAAAWVTAAFLAGASLLFVAHGFICFVVGLNMAFGS